MEILLKEHADLSDSALFYFHRGIPILERAVIRDMKSRFLVTGDKCLELFRLERGGYSYGCYFVGDAIKNEDKFTFSRRILYFVNCHEHGSIEFVLCVNLITGKEILLEYLNGVFRRDLLSWHLDAIIGRTYIHLFNKEVSSKYRLIGYTTNVGYRGEVLTKPLFIELMLEDAQTRVDDIFKEVKLRKRKQISRASTPPFYTKFVIKRVSSVIALSDFLVSALSIKPDTCVLLRFRLNRVYFSFVNLDGDEKTVHLRIRKSSYAHVRKLDAKKFPIVIYLHQLSRIDLISLLDNDVEYELSSLPEFFESNYWYQLIN